MKKVIVRKSAWRFFVLSLFLTFYFSFDLRPLARLKCVIIIHPISVFGILRPLMGLRRAVLPMPPFGRRADRNGFNAAFRRLMASTPYGCLPCCPLAPIKFYRRRHKQLNFLFLHCDLQCR